MAAEQTGGTREILWEPPADVLTTSEIGRYVAWLDRHKGLAFDTYDALWRWSVAELAAFWDSVWEYFEIKAAAGYTETLSREQMPHTRWFAGAQLNYAENALRGADDAVAIIGSSHTRGDSTLTYAELRDEVARAQQGLRQLGVGEGDRVAAVLPNVPEAVVLLLATASLGAVFCSCSPEFGEQAIKDRFAQVAPKVLVGVDGYRFRDKRVERVTQLSALAASLPSVEHVVVVDYLGTAERDHPYASWVELLRSQVPGEVQYTHVAAEHPLYILFSSGTTGVPKAITHGHGGIVVEHHKSLALHHDVGPGDVLFAYATTSWVVWNLAVSGLLRQATVVCFDGDPSWPDDRTLWAEIARWNATNVIVGAAILTKSMAAGLRPGDDFDLSRVRVLSSTGSPLSAEAFYWVYETVSANLQLRSGSGGTDVCTSFIGSCLLLPVVAGEIACAHLGVAIDAFDGNGTSVRDVPGEMVITRPMPSMPVAFWGDPDKAAYEASYFSMYPGVWRHGDWLTISSYGTYRIIGRSDATLNRGGIRLGTAEFYRVVDPLPEIEDSVVVHLEDASSSMGRLVLIVATGADPKTYDTLRGSIRQLIKQQLSPRHLPDEIRFVAGLPRTLTGKRLEVPIKRILTGVAPAEALSVGSITRPETLDQLRAIATAMTAPTDLDASADRSSNHAQLG